MAWCVIGVLAAWRWIQTASDRSGHFMAVPPPPTKPRLAGTGAAAPNVRLNPC